MLVLSHSPNNSPSNDIFKPKRLDFYGTSAPSRNIRSPDDWTFIDHPVSKPISRRRTHTISGRPDLNNNRSPIRDSPNRFHASPENHRQSLPIRYERPLASGFKPYRQKTPENEPTKFVYKVPDSPQPRISPPAGQSLTVIHENIELKLVKELSKCVYKKFLRPLSKIVKKIVQI